MSLCFCVCVYVCVFRRWWGSCRAKHEAGKRRASSCMTSSRFASSSVCWTNLSLVNSTSIRRKHSSKSVNNDAHHKSSLRLSSVCIMPSVCMRLSPGPAILEDVLIEVFRTLHTQCRTELDLQNQSPFSKDHTHLSRSVQSPIHFRHQVEHQDV